MGDPRPVRNVYHVSYGVGRERIQWVECSTPLKAQQVLNTVRRKGFNADVLARQYLVRVRP